IQTGEAIELTGTGFTGDSESGSGTTNNSASNSPMVQLRRTDNNQVFWLTPAATSIRSATSYVSEPLLGVPPGPYALTVFVNAIPSISRIVLVTPIDDVIFADGFE